MLSGTCVGLGGEEMPGSAMKLPGGHRAPSIPPASPSRPPQLQPLRQGLQHCRHPPARECWEAGDRDAAAVPAGGMRRTP